MRKDQKLKRAHRLVFDANEIERKLLYRAAAASGLSFVAWARSELLKVARVSFSDSKQHPDFYPHDLLDPFTTPEAVSAPRPASQPRPAPTSTPPAPSIQRPPRRPREWQPYDPPLNEPDGDGLSDPNEAFTPLGTVKFS